MAKIEGMDALKRKLRALPEAAEKAIAPALQKGAEEIAKAQRALAPKDSGELAGSIEVSAPEHTERGVRVTIEAKAEHALHVEAGTSDTDPQPFFRPGYRLEKKRAQARVKRAMAAAVKAEFNK